MKNAVITGSLSGLAQAVIKQLLNKGYRVFEGDLAIKEETIRGNEYLFPLDLLCSVYNSRLVFVLVCYFQKKLQ